MLLLCISFWALFSHEVPSGPDNTKGKVETGTPRRPLFDWDYSNTPPSFYDTEALTEGLH